LSNQRKAYDQLVHYIKGDKEDLLYNGDQTLETISYPNRLLLSAVRSKTLILFEINHYSTVTGKKAKGFLSLSKIIQNEDITPANVVPIFFSTRKKNKLFGQNVNLIIVDDVLEKLYFIPKGVYRINIPTQMEKLLKDRMHLLQKHEKEFVEQLNIRYTTS
jgi:hypothetical protein